MDSKSSTSPCDSESETLGNKLQRLANINPRAIMGVELLVDTYLRSAAEADARGLTAMALLSGALVNTITFM